MSQAEDKRAEESRKKKNQKADWLFQRCFFVRWGQEDRKQK
jgi:hypothetical protein